MFGQGGFGQQPGQQQLFGFGQQQQQQQPPGSNAAALPPGFSFGAPQTAATAAAAAPFQPMSSHAAAAAPVTGFGFAQQPATQPAPLVFGLQQQQQQQPFSFGAPPPVPATALSSFDFGSAQRKQQQKQPSYQPLPMATAAPHHTKVNKTVGPVEEEEEEFDYEAAKRAALAQMPSFQGTGGVVVGGGGNSAKPASSRPPQQQQQQQQQHRTVAASSFATQTGEDPVEVARREKRANRFAPIPPIAPTSVSTLRRPTAPVFNSSIASSSLFNNVPTRAAPIADAEINGAAYILEDEHGGDGGGGRGPIIGTCEDMCPAVERERRQNMSDIQIFERVDPANPNLTSPELAVRRFARTVDDPHPSEFRTRGALTRTMTYLRGLLDRTDVRFGLVHKFLWDRYRSVRQDLYIQGISDEFAINVFEEIVRFHVLCEHELGSEDQSVTDMEGFNSHLNMEQMNKALISLNEMYNKAAAQGRPSPNEAEFRCYHLVSLMAQHGKFKGDQQAFLSTLQALRPEVRGAPMVQWVLQLRAAFVSENYVRFLLLVREATYLPACAAHTYFPAIRARALRTLSETLTPTTARPAAVEIAWLRRVLMMDCDEDVVTLAASHGFTEMIVDENDTEATSSILLLYKGHYVDPPSPQMKRPAAWITAKAPGLRSVCVTSPAGRPLSPEEAAALQEEQRRVEQARSEAAAAVRAAAHAEMVQQQAAAAAAAAEQHRLQQAAAEQQQREEEARRAAQRAQLEAQRRAEEEVRRQQQADAAAEARRIAEAKAEQERRVAAEKAAFEAARRMAAEAEQRRLAAERRRLEAEAAEKRRLAEEERRKAEELLRKAADLRRRCFERKYFSRWVVRMRHLVAEKRRKEHIAASLKACRVGVAVSPLLDSEEEIEMTAALDGLDIGVDAPGEEQRRGAIDLAPLVAPFLAQNNPHAPSSLFWKISVLLGGGGGSTTTTSQLLLSKWLHFQLSYGRVVPSTSGSVYVGDPVEVSVLNSSSSTASDTTTTTTTTSTVLRTCIVLAHFSTPATMNTTTTTNAAGASGFIVVASDEASHEVIQSTILTLCTGDGRTVTVRPSSLLPVLFVAASEDTAQLWRSVWEATTTTASRPPVNFISLSSSSSTTPTPSNNNRSASFSKTQLMQGLRWLAARSPQQPSLSVVTLEEATRDALGAALVGKPPLTPTATAFEAAIDAVAKAVKGAGASEEARWQWPPVELINEEDPLQGWWCSDSTQTALLSALDRVRLHGNNSSDNDTSPVALHVRVGEVLSTVKQPLLVLVMPESVRFDFCAALTALSSVRETLTSNSLTQALLTTTSSNLKRKWRNSPDDVDDGDGGDDGGAVAARVRMRHTLDSLKVNLAAERQSERQFENELTQAAIADAVVVVGVTSNAIIEESEDADAEEEEQLSNGIATVVQSRALQELNAALQAERKASRSLWGRVRSMASTLLF